jgi:hypothetical protein
VSSPLIDNCVAGLHRRLPAAIADEAADGLIEAYQHHLAAGASDQAAAATALAEFGDLTMVVGEFTRQAPGRQTSRRLLASGPAVGACWAAALILARAWAWPVPGTARLIFGSLLLATITALAIAATSRHSYQRTRLTALAGPALVILDTTAITAALLTAPAPTWPLRIAIAASLARIVLTLVSLPRITAR